MPTYFRAQAFRLATTTEQKQLALLGYFLTDADFIFCFESDGRAFFIAAHELSVREGFVPHYQPSGQ